MSQQWWYVCALVTFLVVDTLYHTDDGHGPSTSARPTEQGVLGYKALWKLLVIWVLTLWRSASLVDRLVVGHYSGAADMGRIVGMGVRLPPHRPVSGRLRLLDERAGPGPGPLSSCLADDY